MFWLIERMIKKHSLAHTYARDFEIIQNLIIAGKSNLYVRMLAQLKGADIKRLERRIIDTGSQEEMLKLAKVVDCPKIRKLGLLF